MVLVDAIAEGRAGARLAGPLLAIGFGALLTAYFAVLAVRKARHKRSGS